MATTKYRKYAAAIIFTKTKTKAKAKFGNLFLLLRRKQNWKGWEYVKGGLLPGESALKGLKREIFEETGQKRFRIIAKLPLKIKYKWPKAYLKDEKRWRGAVQTVYLIEVFSRKIRLDRLEHNGFAWVSAKLAMDLLTHKEPKAALKFVLKKYPGISKA